MTSLLTSDQLALLREAHYEGSAYLVAGPQETVFAARVNGAPNAASSDFAQVSFDSVTTGAYTDLIVDMDVRISHTSDIRKAFFFGRVRKTPTSTILYINETSAAILDNDYIFAVDNYPLVIRQRRLSFVDWDVPYEGLGPVESNVPSASLVTTTAATAQFSFSSLPQAVEKGTTVTDILWTFTDVTYIVGSATTADITIEVDTPYNAWGHETLTDSDGVARTLHFTLTAGDPDTDTFFRLCHDPVTIASDWDTGQSCGATYWAGIDDLLDRTRITLVTVETFDGDPLGVSNIGFVGYLHGSVSSTQGDEIHGQSKDAALIFNGFNQLAGEIRFNQIAIRNASVPTVWDYINLPTPPRNIVHLLAHHSTFLNLCSLDLSDIDETYLTGNDNVEESSLTDAARKAVREINGTLIQAADGIMTLIQDPRLMDDTYRASLSTLTPSAIDLGDVYSYKLTEDTYDGIGWEDVGFLTLNPTTLTPTFITANAPASGPGDGQANTEEPSQLLAATDDLTTALTEARQRTADLYALANTHRTLEVNFGSGWGGVVVATAGLYYQFNVSAADDTRGNGIDADDLWLCLSVNVTINRTGTQDTIGQFSEVTQGGDALINAAISPSVVSTPEVVRPYVSPYPSQPMAASINSDTTEPTSRHHRDPFSGMQPLPMTTEEAAQAAQNQAGVGESNAYTNFRYDGDQTMGFISVLDAPYLLTVSGSAKVYGDATVRRWNFRVTDGAADGWTGNIGEVDYSSEWIDGVGWRGNAAGNLDRNFIEKAYGAATDVISAAEEWSTVSDYTSTNWWIGIDGSFGSPTSMTPGQTDASLDINASITAVRLGIERSGGLTTAVADLIGATIVEAASGTDTYGDAFYIWNLDTDGNMINVQLNPGGLRIDNAAIAVVPPFNKNSIYPGLPFVGTGNAIQFRYRDTNYGDNTSAPFYLSAKGEGAGS